MDDLLSDNVILVSEHPINDSESNKGLHQPDPDEPCLYQSKSYTDLLEPSMIKKLLSSALSEDDCFPDVYHTDSLLINSSFASSCNSQIINPFICTRQLAHMQLVSFLILLSLIAHRLYQYPWHTSQLLPILLVLSALQSLMNHPQLKS